MIPIAESYVLDDHEIHCNCGNIIRFSTLSSVVKTTRERARHTRPSGKSEIIFDLPIEHRPIQRGTARCHLCIETAPREPVPNLDPQRVTGLYKGSTPTTIDISDLDFE